MKTKTLNEITEELIECDHEGEDALRTLEEWRDSLEEMAELGLLEAIPILKITQEMIGKVLDDRNTTGNTYGHTPTNNLYTTQNINRHLTFTQLQK